MTKEIEIAFPKRNLSVSAVLLEDDAPKTCAAVWKVLQEPLESTAIHAIAAGREIYCEIPPTESVPPENQALCPLPGEIMYVHIPPRFVVGGRETDFYELAMWYGRDSRCYLIGYGYSPANLFAKIRDEDLATFDAIGNNIHMEGAEKVVARRSK